MTNRITVAGDVPVVARIRRSRGTVWKPLTEQRPHGIERRLVVGDQIELRAIAGGEQNPALAPAAMTRASAAGTSCAPWANRSRTSSGAVRCSPYDLIPISI